MKADGHDPSPAMRDAASANNTRRRVLARIAVASGIAAAPTWLHAQTGDEFGAHVLRGAGSTFVHPLMNAWAREYRRHRHGSAGSVARAGGGLDDDVGGVALDYEAVGSLAGIQRLRTQAVDFAASEVPLPDAELRRLALVQVPLVAGAVVVAYNLGLPTPLQLNGTVLADIFLGRIKRWSDTDLRALNPGAPLPDTPIAVIHRADGSGTTYTFADYLARVSAPWKEQLGVDLLINWPVGTGHRGNRGVADGVRRTAGAIGYVSLTQAQETTLPMARLKNAAGAVVVASAAGVEAALSQSAWARGGAWDASLNNLEGAASWPINAAVYGLASTAMARRARRAREFMAWALVHGGSSAQRLGFVTLPAAITNQAVARVGQL
jgi:phosphate transport system substrate-binding protein